MGRNAFSGAVNYITKAPNQEETEFGGSVTYGSHGKRSVGGYVSGPLVDDMVAFRLDYTHDETGGTWKNSTNGERLNDANSESLRARLLITPGDKFSLDYTFTWLDRHTSSQALYGVPANELDSGYRLDFVTFSYQPIRKLDAHHRPDSDLDLHPSPGNNHETFRHTAKIEYDAEDFVTTLAIAYTKEEITSIFDATYGLGGDIMMMINPAYLMDPTNPTISPVSFLDLNGDFIPDQVPVLGGQPNQDPRRFLW